MNAPKINLISSKKAAQVLFAKHCFNGRREVDAAIAAGSTLDEALDALRAKLAPYFTDASVETVVKTVRSLVEMGLK